MILNSVSVKIFSTQNTAELKVPNKLLWGIRGVTELE